MANRATVAVLRVGVDSIFSDIDRLVDLAGVSTALAGGKTTILKDNTGISTSARTWCGWAEAI